VAELTHPLLSVVIRCRNEARGLRNVLAALRAQRCAFAWEIVLVDNESEDDTRAMATDFGARVVTISRQEFTYGRAINRGIAATQGELILLLSAHALPLGEHFLAAAAAPFHDQQVAAARCLLVAKPHQLEQWHQPYDIHYATPAEQQKAESGRDWVSQYPAASCCVLRKSVWTEIPFDEMIEANEDKQWASRVLARGYKIHCSAQAFWMHTRHLTRPERWKKEVRELVALHRLTGYAPLSWSRYAWLMLRAVLLAPLIAIRHIVHNFVWNTYQVTVPWRARRAAPSGSVAAFDRKQ
jgi:glycosyltransferase involved in cell wall biosynthesis